MHWRQIQRRNFTSFKILADFLELAPDQRSKCLFSPRFPINVPLRLAQKIEKGTLDDPLFRQFVPLAKELQSSPGFCGDPVGDEIVRHGGKLLHKYEGRALLLSTSACAMHCRYCFRQNFPYETQDRSFETELDYLAKTPSIHEVILSGGDPLSLSTENLDNLISRLHVKRLRFHTRFPIGIPERIDTEFLDLLASTQMQVIFVIHCNHPLELDHDVLTALKEIQKLGIPVLNQTVLLKDVNDNEETLFTLFERMADHGIIPYYLHQLDRVQGAAHFEANNGHTLIEKLRTRLPGFAIPTYVQEIAGEKSKTPIINNLAQM